MRLERKTWWGEGICYTTSVGASSVLKACLFPITNLKPCLHSKRRRRKNLTQSRLRPISPFSYVGQGRKGAKERQMGQSPLQKKAWGERQNCKQAGNLTDPQDQLAVRARTWTQ